MAKSRFNYLALVALLVERALAALWAWIAPAFALRPAFSVDLAARQVAFAGDCPIDQAMSHSLRHEAGMRRLH